MSNVDGLDLSGSGNQKSLPVDAEKEANRRRIREAFACFDQDSKGIIVKEELGTIMRYLGIYPSEQQLVTEILPQVLDDEETYFAKYERVESVILDCLASNKYEPDSDETILQAFKVLDKNGHGVLTEDEIVGFLTSNEWAFREKELENFLRVAKNTKTNEVVYEDYIEEMHNF